MKNQQIGILLLLATTLASIPLALTVPATEGSVLRNITIIQYNSTFGSGCSGQVNCFNFTSPGPTIIVDQGDTISFTIKNNDTTTHTFTITQAPYTSVDTGNMSPGQVKTLPTFTASTSGSFHYQCNIHPTTMKGTFQVNPVSASPITPASLLALISTATAAVFITVRKRR